MAVSVGIDEDLEVIVMKNDGIMLGKRRPDVRLFYLRPDIEIIVIPEHLDTRSEAGEGLAIALNIDEVLGPGSVLPGRVVELTIDGDRTAGPVTEIASGNHRFFLFSMSLSVPLDSRHIQQESCLTWRNSVCPDKAQVADEVSCGQPRWNSQMPLGIRFHDGIVDWRSC